MARRLFRTPTACPVCGSGLHTTRLSCGGCGTELSGQFPSCEFCALPADDRDLLRVFLRSRGNLKEVERYLGVSYPTARSRFDAVLARLGLAHDPPAGAGRDAEEKADDDTGAEAVRDPIDLLRAVAVGDVDVDEAARRLQD